MHTGISKPARARRRRTSTSPPPSSFLPPNRAKPSSFLLLILSFCISCTSAAKSNLGLQQSRPSGSSGIVKPNIGPRSSTFLPPPWFTFTSATLRTKHSSCPPSPWYLKLPTLCLWLLPPSTTRQHHLAPPLCTPSLTPPPGPSPLSLNVSSGNTTGSLPLPSKKDLRKPAGREDADTVPFLASASLVDRILALRQVREAAARPPSTSSSPLPPPPAPPLPSPKPANTKPGPSRRFGTGVGIPTGWKGPSGGIGGRTGVFVPSTGSLFLPGFDPQAGREGG
ncbi:hypothetical protein Naga_100146g1, partial [Nannochloropsis gaditana]